MRPRSPRTPLQQAVGLLSRREHSQHELQRKLIQRGAEAEPAAAALARLAAAGLQDDQRFAESLIRQRVSAGYGPQYLRAELATHRLPAELIERVLGAAEVDWDDLASDLIRRRFPTGVVEPRDARRAQALLMRRGFSPDSIRQALRTTD